jgi:5-hydroxyisourate hydrolase-like protein (transthyretin family)
MGFKEENYTPKGLCVGIFLWMMITCNHTFAQTAAHCPIRVDFEPRIEQVPNAANDTRQNLFPFFTSWQNLDNLRLSDDNYAIVSLDGYRRSTMAFGEKMSFNIPKGAKITGIEIFVEGHTQGEGDAEGLTVQLLNYQGQRAGENKATSALPIDKDWPATSDSTDFIWRYGNENDDWGLDLNQFMVNNPNFGYVLQVRNKLAQSIEVLIDNIQIVVHYIPLYAVCTDHACVPFYIDKSDDPQVTYEWYIPQGWELISDSENDAAINIGPSYAELGTYEICVESFFAGNTQGVCCRKFNFEDCNPGMISGEVFLDQNGNFTDDNTDTPQANVLVNLYESNGAFLSSTSTDNNGEYLFPAVFQGDYFIEVELQDGFTFVIPNIGSEQNDSDITNTLGIGSTDLISVNSGEEVVDVDVGLSKSLTLGDYVWEDLNGDGIQQEDEPGIEGINVNISNNLTSGTITTTDVNGFYQFMDIPSSDYLISFENPTGFVTTLLNNGNAETDNDYDGTPIILSYLTGGDVDSIDAGFLALGSIGDFVWEDLNEDGIQDADESGLPDVILYLKGDDGTLLDSTITDANGKYEFTDLTPGVYTLEANADDFFSLTITNSGTDTSLDSDGILVDGTISTNPITIISGTQNTDIDFGFFILPVSISGFTWIDENDDGQFQLEESFIGNLLVSLFDTDGTLIADTLSDLGGFYTFEDKKAGTYYLQYDILDGYIFTDANIGDDLSDSDVDGTNGLGTTAEFTLIPGEISIDNAAGYIKLPSVEGLTWEDINGNGTRESDEPIITEIRVNLRAANGDLIETDTTDALGVYRFESLPIADYYIEFIKDEDLQFTSHIVDIAFNSDVDGVISAGATSVFSLDGNQELADIDAGFLVLSSIGDFVWEDLNEDGIQDADESGLQDVILYLKDDNGILLDSVITDANGKYEFTDLTPGVYTLEANADEFLSLTIANSGTDTTLDSDGILADGTISTNPITIISGTQNTDIDFGFFILPVSISGFTWIDENNDGQYQLEESFIGNLLVSLFDTDGTLIADTLSDLGGFFTFEDKKAGTYYLQYDILDGYLFTDANIGDNLSDSDVDGTNGTGTTAEFTLLPGEISIDNAAGYIIRPSVEGLTWEDINGNGTRESDEPIITGIKVNLRAANGDLIGMDTTDALGMYGFESLSIGDYYIEFIKDEDLQFTSHIADIAFNSDVDGVISAGATSVFSLSGNQKLADIDAGFFTFGSIGDFVWEDINGNGIQELDEPGLAGVMIALKNDQGEIIKTRETGETGYYIFTEVTPGSYTIILIQDPFYTITLANQGDNELDSDAMLVDGVITSPTIIISSGDELLNIDFGFFELPSIIGGFTWLDANNDGQFQIEEPIIPNVNVSLYYSNGDLIDQTASDEGGLYSFQNSVVGDVYLQFELPDGKIYTIANQGDDLSDSDVTSEIITGSTSLITLIPGEENLTNSAGYLALPKVGDYVWLDNNRNGLQDVEELGLNGVGVSLYSIEGSIIESTVTSTNVTTGTDGYYLFDTLSIGDYYISFELVDTLDFAPQVDSDLLLNSDITGENGEGTTAIFSLIGNQCNFDIDGGYSLIKSEISGEVWVDSDLDGVQNPDNIFVEGIVIKLYSEANSEISSTISDSLGQYAFNDLDAGSYYVAFDTTERYSSTLPLQGSDFALDSDIDDSQIQGSTGIIILENGFNAKNIDAGLIDGAISIDGFTWIDDNNNGTKETEELILENIEVKLYALEGTLLDSITVDEMGNYDFPKVFPGEYYLVFNNQDESFFNVLADQGPDDIDDDITNEIITGSTDTISVSYFNELQSINGGYYQLASVGDMTFIDLNENGINDQEPGLDRVTVNLLNLDGEVIQSTMTDQGGGIDSGYYFIEDIVPGEYQLQFVRPLFYQFIDANIGINDTIDSDVELVEANIGTTDTFSITSGSTNTTLDAGFVFTTPIESSITGIVWEDENANGTLDTGEVFRSSVIVALLDNGGSVIDTKSTNTDGAYTFNMLQEGFYTLRISLIGNETATIPNIGVDDEIDSDFNIAGLGVETEQFFLENFEAKDHVDLGIVEKITIGDFIWEDIDNSGTQGGTEIGLANILVTISDISTTITETTVSDETGEYKFMDLPAGNYQVCATLPEGYFVGKKDTGIEQLDSDANPDGCTDFMVFNSGSNNDIDIALTREVSINGIVFTDLNGNGIKNITDPGIDEVPVFLFSGTGIKLDSTITATVGDTSGIYSFTNLQVGEYYVVFEIPSEYILSDGNSGPDDVDSDISNAFGTGSTDVIILESGEDYQNLDGGAYLPACIGDRVWEDLDKNGLQDSGEGGVEGIEVIIFRSFGVPFDTVYTNVTGDYKFSGLKQGLYFIQFMIPQEYTITLSDVDIDDNVDSDADETGKTPLISLAHGADLTSIDCGIFLSMASLRSVVWEDLNGDGMRQPVEARIPDIRVSLFDEAGQIVASTISNALGLYAFQEIPVGNYKVFIDLANTDYTFTTIDISSNDLLDSDIHENGESDMFASAEVLSVPNVDVGLFEMGSIGSIAWLDEDQNGIYDLNEDNLSNIKVSLYNEADDMISELTTEANGDENISFSNLRPGQYHMEYKFKKNLEASLENGEIDADNNSDIILQEGIYSSPAFTVESSNIVTHIDAGFFTKTNAVINAELSNGKIANSNIEPVIHPNVPSQITKQEVSELVISVHPNPATNYIRVEIANKENATVKVINGDNKVVISASAAQMEHIDLRHLHPGIYYVVLEQDGKTATKKLIKVH